MSDAPVVPPGIVLCTHCGARLSATVEIPPGAAPLCPDCAEERASTRRLATVAAAEWISIREDLPAESRPRRRLLIAAAATLVVAILAAAAFRPRHAAPAVAVVPPPAPPPLEPPPPTALEPQEPKKEPPAEPKPAPPDPRQAELAAIDDESLAFEGAEEFKRVFDLLEKARGRHEEESWRRGIEGRVTALRQKVDAQFAVLREFAAEAKDAAERTRLRERVAKWGMTDLAAELEKILADVTAPPPPPPRSKESQAYLEEWERILARAGTREYDRALPELRKAAKAAQEDAVRKEAAADIDDLTRVVMVYDEIQRMLAAWPRGKAIALETAGSKVAGAFVSGDVDRIEIRTGASRETAFVEISEATAASLAALARGKADPHALGLFCLIEGHPAAAKTFFDRRDEAPAKYWAWSAVARQKIPPPDEETIRRERLARELYYAAERDYRRPATRGSAVEKYRALMKDFLESALVRRTAKRIAARTEGCSEFYFVTDDLTAGGTFKRAARGPAGACWLASSESDMTRGHENFVEIEFATMGEEKYRCWIQVGGCCAETFLAFYQVTGLVVPHPAKAGQSARAEPGSLYAVAVAPPAMTIKATHASHGGQKEPALWGWIEVPLPKFAQPGVKRVRLCTVVQGFAVARAVVSSTRSATPKEDDLKELEAAREPDLPPAPSGAK